jgi:hypothetical protein
VFSGFALARQQDPDSPYYHSISGTPGAARDFAPAVDRLVLLEEVYGSSRSCVGSISHNSERRRLRQPGPLPAPGKSGADAAKNRRGSFIGRAARRNAQDAVGIDWRLPTLSGNDDPGASEGGATNTPSIPLMQFVHAVNANQQYASVFGAPRCWIAPKSGEAAIPISRHTRPATSRLLLKILL